MKWILFILLFWTIESLMVDSRFIQIGGPLYISIYFNWIMLLGIGLFSIVLFSLVYFCFKLICFGKIIYFTLILPYSSSWFYYSIGGLFLFIIRLFALFIFASWPILGLFIYYLLWPWMFIHLFSWRMEQFMEYFLFVLFLFARQSFLTLKVWWFQS